MSEEPSDDALLSFGLGGGMFPPSKFFCILSRNEKTSRDNSKRISSDREESS